jgi:hypothetical protein
MLYATTIYNKNFGGHVKSDNLTDHLNDNFFCISHIQADGDELVKCCEILGRNLPKRRVYTFLGNNAQEIAKNWDSN